MTSYSRFIDSPLGQILLCADSHGIQRIELPQDKLARPAPTGSCRHDNRHLAAAEKQITEYFAAQRKHFDLSLAIQGTSFQEQVWQALQSIPYGQTLSYGGLCQRIGRPRAARAVGAACGRNPLPIVLPCHRVLGRQGALTGFYSGLENKRWLLNWEATQQTTAAIY